VADQAVGLDQQEYLEQVETEQAVKVLRAAITLQVQITEQEVVAAHLRLAQTAQHQTAEMVEQDHQVQSLGLLLLTQVAAVAAFKITQLRVRVVRVAVETVQLIVQLPHLAQQILVVAAVVAGLFRQVVMAAQAGLA
jgi:hypothetical protein